MSRGNSSGGGQSSLGYLFGGGEQPKPVVSKSVVGPATTVPAVTEAAQPKPTVKADDIPAGIPAKNLNNYQRADGQNAGNFITDRPSTKVHAAPGGGSSLNYLFGGGGN